MSIMSQWTSDQSFNRDFNYLNNTSTVSILSNSSIESESRSYNGTYELGCCVLFTPIKHPNPLKYLLDCQVFMQCKWKDHLNISGDIYYPNPGADKIDTGLLSQFGFKSTFPFLNFCLKVWSDVMMPIKLCLSELLIFKLEHWMQTWNWSPPIMVNRRNGNQQTTQMSICFSNEFH